jgi:hypothetical protein
MIIDQFEAQPPARAKQQRHILRGAKIGPSTASPNPALSDPLGANLILRFRLQPDTVCMSENIADFRKNRIQTGLWVSTACQPELWPYCSWNGHHRRSERSGQQARPPASRPVRAPGLSAWSNPCHCLNIFVERAHRGRVLNKYLQVSLGEICIGHRDGSLSFSAQSMQHLAKVAFASEMPQFKFFLGVQEQLDRRFVEGEQRGLDLGHTSQSYVALRPIDGNTPVSQVVTSVRQMLPPASGRNPKVRPVGQPGSLSSVA